MRGKLGIGLAALTLAAAGVLVAVVPIGSAMIGTVIRRASTTETTGGGGTRSAAA